MHQATPQAARSFEPENYQRNAAFVPKLGAEILGWLAPQPGERILDLGAGDGVLTESLVAAGARVVALDASPAMVKAARARGLDAVVGDGEQLDFDQAFDAVFSNAALHWIRDPRAVSAGVHRALRPGGRFVAEAGGFGCVAAVRVALGAALAVAGFGVQEDPWYFPTADAHRRVLEEVGFEVETCVVVARPTPLPTGFPGWLETFGRDQLAAVPADDRGAIVAHATSLLRRVLRDEEGRDVADYTRLRFRARRP